MRFLESRLTRAWYSPKAPAGLLARVSDRIAAWAEQRMLDRRECPGLVAGVPVVVIGNITVGGTGKTPLIIHLAESLVQSGFRVGVVSRGHGGSGPFPLSVMPDTPAAAAGDEPSLIARRCRIPVVVDPVRRRGCEFLIRQFEPDVVLADDGLQHYALPRQIEVVVLDGARGIGNGLMLPFGPLREPASRLGSVHAIVCNGEPSPQLEAVLPNATLVKRYQMQMEPARWRTLSGDVSPAAPGVQRPVMAVSGIGNPGRFHATLRGSGLIFEVRDLGDHHHYQRSDFADLAAYDVVMTEKDAVKVDPAWVQHGWVLPVRAAVKPALADDIVRWLSTSSHRPLGE